jgi:hypothetical protein
MVVAHFESWMLVGEAWPEVRSGLSAACRDHGQCAMPGMFEVPQEGVSHCCFARM